MMNGIPQPFLNKMALLLGHDYDKFATCLNERAINGIRVNTIKTTSQELLSRLPYPLSPIPWCENGFVIDTVNLESGVAPPGKHPYHSAGLYYLQEPSAMVVGHVLRPKPGESVLDVAAAPGGKATHIAALMNNAGLIVANEIHPQRVWDLAGNIERLGIKNSIILNETPQSLARYFNEYFDWVVVDAPCSGEGMFRKSEIARQEWNSALPYGCSTRQMEILTHASRCVKPGGNLVYSTCTFSPEENEGVISEFLEGNPEFDIKTVEGRPGVSKGRPEWVSLPADHAISGTLRIWPHITKGEGHFCALLVKKHPHGLSRPSFREINQNRSKDHEFVSMNPSVIKFFRDFVNHNLSCDFDERKLVLVGNYLYQLPDIYPKINNMKLIRSGLWLGTIKNDRFIPSHALVMAMRIDQCKNHIVLKSDDPLIHSYLHGESFYDAGEDGWVMITVDGFPLGWGKRVNHIIKNHLPRGLRY